MFEGLRSRLSGFVNKFVNKELTEKNMQDVSKQLEQLLIRDEVAVSVAEEISSKVLESLVSEEIRRFSSPMERFTTALRLSLEEILTPKETVPDLIQEIKNAKEMNEPYVILFLGINGTGKTTTLAKMANLFQESDFSVVFAASDTYRAGSIQQLEKHAEKLKIRIIQHKYGSDPAAVAFDAINHALAKNVDVVMIDTAGRMQTNTNLMNELKKIKKIAEPNFTIFVGDGLAGNDVIKQAQDFDKFIGFDATILTKMDASVKGGAAISVASITKKPILYMGVGQGYSDIEPFVPIDIVENIISSENSY
ncbi:MAG: signal recognition particle-docking protein FtsY [Candidatus Kariarchaeaceae archaeon]